MPQSLLRVARFRGLDRMKFLDNCQFNGNAFTFLANAERFLRDTLPIAGRFEQDRFERIDELLYPPLATREALANALCHRDYSIGGGSVGGAVYDDRLEVTSSGSLHFGLTPEKLFAPHESRPWNPLIARTFKMAELTRSAGLPALGWINDPGDHWYIAPGDRQFTHVWAPALAGCGRKGVAGHAQPLEGEITARWSVKWANRRRLGTFQRRIGGVWQVPPVILGTLRPWPLTLAEPP